MFKMRLIKTSLLCIFYFVLVGCNTTGGNIAPDQIGDDKPEFKMGKSTITIETAHHNDVTLVSLIEGKTHRKQTIKATLYLPGECTEGKKFPAVIVDHDSGGLNKSYYRTLPKQLMESGFVVVVPDHYSTRGIRSTSGAQQGKLSYGSRFYDVMQTLKATASLPCVDAKRVGITGYSIGGQMAMLAVEKKYSKMFAGGLYFKAAMPVYPACERVQRNTSPTATKVLLVGGELDTNTPFSTCKMLVPYYKKNGWQISSLEIKGAYHNFIFDTAPKHTNSATFAGCGLRWMEKDGSITAEKFGLNIKSESSSDWKSLVSQAINSGCVQRGYIYGGTQTDRNSIIQLTLDFFSKSL